MCAHLCDTSETYNCSFIHVLCTTCMINHLLARDHVLLTKLSQIAKLPHQVTLQWQLRLHYLHITARNVWSVCSVNSLRALNNVASVNSGLATIDRGD